MEGAEVEKIRRVFAMKGGEGGREGREKEGDLQEGRCRSTIRSHRPPLGG